MSVIPIKEPVLGAMNQGPGRSDATEQALVNNNIIHNMNIIWRVASVALLVGLALFLLTLILKVLLVGAGLFLLARVVGRRLFGRSFGPWQQGRVSASHVIAIDNPGYRYSAAQPSFERVISIG